MSVTIEMNPAETKALITAVLDIADKKVRRRGLERAGRAAAAIQKPVMKKLAGERSVTGALARSIGSKVTTNKAKTKVTAIVGPIRSKGKGKGKLAFAVTRKTRDGQSAALNRKGEQLYRQPTRYAHLAGPKRKSNFVQQAVAQTRGAVEAAMADALREAIEGK